jgi:histidine triad (HIT) family protein
MVYYKADGCLFCDDGFWRKIVIVEDGENEHAFIIRDRAPVAKEHLLVISKHHFDDIAQAWDMTSDSFRGILGLAQKYAKKHLPNGFRMVINTGADAGQTIKHFHIHLLGGEKLKDL